MMQFTPQLNCKTFVEFVVLADNFHIILLNISIIIIEFIYQFNYVILTRVYCFELFRVANYYKVIIRYTYKNNLNHSFSSSINSFQKYFNYLHYCLPSSSNLLFYGLQFVVDHIGGNVVVANIDSAIFFISQTFFSTLHSINY